MKYIARNCDCCGSTAEPMEAFCWNRVVRTRLRDFNWKVRNVVCRECGFAYVSPAPTDESLLDYYGSSYALFEGATLGETNRVAFLREIGGDALGHIVEIGGNRAAAFESALAPYAQSYNNCELNDEIAGTTRSIASLPDASADFVISYYVFEHVVSLDALLRQCLRIMKADGTLVIEVPDIAYYPLLVDAVALHEHVNHFSLRTLAAVVCQRGFRVQAVSRKFASRNFGFVAAFRKGSSPERQPAPWEVSDAMSCLAAGYELVKNKWKSAQSLGEQLAQWAASGEKLVLWCANQVSRDVLQGLKIPGSVVFLDSNPEKNGYVDGHPTSHPDQRTSDIKNADRIVIFSPDAANAILNQVKGRYGRASSLPKVAVADLSSPAGCKSMPTE